MSAHHQNTRNMSFKVPLVPYIPALSIFCNIELMVHLSALTWIRFFVWIVIGMLMYFCYGIHHSKEGTLGTSYSMLLTSNDAGCSSSATTVSGGWGATAKYTWDKMFSRHRRTADDKTSIVIEDDDS